MADLLKSYAALTSASPKSQVSDILQSIIDAPPFQIDTKSRTSLIEALLKDLKVCQGSKAGAISSKEAAQALLAIKSLGKHPSGSQYLASPSNLSTLLSFSTSFKDDPVASGEALRTIANALLLVESARDTILQKDVDGGNIAMNQLEKTTSPDHVFILSRILFLATVSGHTFVETLVEGKYHGRTVVDIIGSKLDTMTTAILTGTKMAKEAMTDLLKFTFNLLMHYPKMVDCEAITPEARKGADSKVVGDFWSSRLDGILQPLIRVFASLPPSYPAPISAPLTHVIHALITIPINPSLRPIWLGGNNTPSSSTHTSKAPSNANTPPKSSSRCQSPTRTQSPTSPKPSTLDRALSSVKAAGRKPFSRSSTPQPAQFDVLQQAMDLLEVAFSHHFPNSEDPDSQEVREAAKKETGDNSLDDLLSPLVVLITRFCIADETSRTRVRQWLVPEDLDRSSPLESRPDTLGRCLRLLASVYHPRLKDSVGEMVYAMADSNATTLSALVGYGNVAGFLFHKGVLSAPTPDASSSASGASLTTPDGAAINPITGTTVQKEPLPEMTDEEKEQEMEKLFVLFNRLEKTGALPPDQNPMRKIIQQAAEKGL